MKEANKSDTSFDIVNFYFYRNNNTMNNLIKMKHTRKTGFSASLIPLLHIYYHWIASPSPKKALHTQMKCEVLETLIYYQATSCAY